jgi:hypothetical protein
MSNLESKKVLIVGGSSGIGAPTATAFAGLGAEVTIASRNQAKLDAVAAGISGHVRTAVAVEAFFATAGQFDHVVISAVQTPGGPVRQLKLSDAYAAMNSKFWGAYRVARVVKIAEGGSGVWLSQRASEREFGVARRNQCGAGSVSTRSGTRVVAFAGEYRFARTDSHAAVVEAGCGRATEDVRQRRDPAAGTACRSAGGRCQRYRLSGRDGLRRRLDRAGRWWRSNRLNLLCPTRHGHLFIELCQKCPARQHGRAFAGWPIETRTPSSLLTIRQARDQKRPCHTA